MMFDGILIMMGLSPQARKGDERVQGEERVWGETDALGGEQQGQGQSQQRQDLFQRNIQAGSWPPVQPVLK